MKRISWNGIQERITRFPRVAAEHAFPFLLLLIVAAGAFSFILFYIYGFSSQTKHVEQEKSVYDVKGELFQDTLGELEGRAQNFENASKGSSRDIFNPTELTGE